MKLRYIDEFRDPQVARRLLSEIKNISHKPVRLMEVCGTHTMNIGRYGLRRLLPPHIRPISGPGCPVCVTGSHTSLNQQQANGADIRVVYSSFDALRLASKNLKPVVFLGVGFETTAPTIAATIIEAKKKKVRNFLSFLPISLFHLLWRSSLVVLM